MIYIMIMLMLTVIPIICRLSNNYLATNKSTYKNEYSMEPLLEYTATAGGNGQDGGPGVNGKKGKDRYETEDEYLIWLFLRFKLVAQE